MVTQQARSNSVQVIVLLAHGFKEGSAIYCLVRLREAGINASLVGISAGLISGSHGISVRPDSTLGQVMDVPPPKIVLFPDGKKSVLALLADPRVHRLLAATIKNNGIIAAMPVAASMLDSLELKLETAVSPLITQSHGTLDEFANRLINLVIS
ncbi:MAG: DJ-1/PfpI family protein [Anaerolineales bacterium]|nr:DJ-1/PfpI family protein [Anaerolineales bacterium]